MSSENNNNNSNNNQKEGLLKFCANIIISGLALKIIAKVLEAVSEIQHNYLLKIGNETQDLEQSKNENKKKSVKAIKKEFLMWLKENNK